MADITEATPIIPLLPDPGKRSRDKEKRHPPEKKPERPPMRESISDVTFIMGIPAEEVTEKVQEAISVIMNELDHLRGQLSHANEKIDFLEQASEEHSFLPIMNHRGLTRELTRIIGLSERTGTVNSFICIHIKNISDIRRQQGRKAAKAALTRAVEIISGNILNTDIVGSLGGNDIGVILTVAGKEEAAEKAKQLIQAIESEDEPTQLHADSGVHVLNEGESANEAIDAADNDCMIGETEQKGKYRRRTGKSRRTSENRREDDSSGDNVG